MFNDVIQELAEYSNVDSNLRRHEDGSNTFFRNSSIFLLQCTDRSRNIYRRPERAGPSMPGGVTNLHTSSPGCNNSTPSDDQRN